MCGIVAAAARRNVVPLLIEGLRRLEYRGYDSCGIATVGDDGLRRARSTQRVAELARQAKELNAPTGLHIRVGPLMEHQKSAMLTPTFPVDSSVSCTTALLKITSPFESV